jgi:hypothetical protein
MGKVRSHVNHRARCVAGFMPNLQIRGGCTENVRLAVSKGNSHFGFQRSVPPVTTEAFSQHGLFAEFGGEKRKDALREFPLGEYSNCLIVSCKGAS